MGEVIALGNRFLPSFVPEHPETADRTRFIPGAELLLGMEGKIKLLAATDPRIPRDDLEAREDFIMSLAGNQRIPYCIVVLGASHVFGGKESCGPAYRSGWSRHYRKDNIFAWNQKHPDEQFSLIEIVPVHRSRDSSPAEGDVPGFRVSPDFLGRKTTDK
jgi:hypothetical protein